MKTYNDVKVTFVGSKKNTKGNVWDTFKFDVQTELAPVEVFFVAKGGKKRKAGEMITVKELNLREEKTESGVLRVLTV